MTNLRHTRPRSALCVLDCSLALVRDIPPAERPLFVRYLNNLMRIYVRQHQALAAGSRPTSQFQL